ncbi:MAG: metallopeptidase family protein [Firmicutes bacterium]|nr:metallopeptidase family protein [Bacillota bacterium]
MKMNYRQVGDILDMLAEELPQEFYRELSGGIILVPEAKQSPHGPDLLIMGEYVRSQMGRMIKIYYGSFERMYRHLDEQALTEQLREVLRHEFTHHIESLAGERGLEIKDEQQIRDYLNSCQISSKSL